LFDLLVNTDLLLDVLVPAYNRTEGLQVILNAYALAPGNVRLILSDDSTTDAVEQLVSQHPVRDKVVYRRNTPSLGAIPNWNSLMELAEAPYLVVMHHDDVPNEVNFFEPLVQALKIGDVDALLLDIWLPGIFPNRLRRHSTRFLRSLVVQHCPGYLLIRNLLGPPSVFVLRSNLAIPFDPAIPWMVDVTWYVRILEMKSLQIRLVAKPSLRSYLFKDSISGLLEDSPMQRRQKESRHLLNAGYKSYFLGMNAGSSLGHRFAWFLEQLIWPVLRAIQLVVLNLQSRRG
jgi:glycosyltransferase involved in cell wall biosynthesis